MTVQQRVSWAVLAGAAALAGSLLCSPPDAPATTAECGQYSVDRDQVHITGRLGDAESFAGLFQVTSATSGGKPRFQPAGDLTSTGGGPTIAESRITITNPGEPLEAGTPATVRIAVSGVRFVGNYIGQVTLAGNPDCAISVTVDATAPAKLALLNNKLSLGLAACRGTPAARTAGSSRHCPRSKPATGCSRRSTTRGGRTQS